ncbi:MAG TPA: trigger factor [Gammaproteobacteria bacterium]|nr:trigger factor [Gammaproteobacteria bacterium]
MASQGQVDISVEAAEGLKRQITVRVPTATIDREVDLRLQQMSKTARLKGFRPGKVPAKVVRKRYGGQVRQEVVGEIIRSSFSHAVTQKQMNPAGGPAIEPLAASDDKHFAYRATFEVYPEIELKAIGELSFEAPEVAIEDVDIDKMIERLRKQKGQWKAVERAAADGDRVVVDFVGRIGKEPFEGGEGKKVKVVLGADQVVADFEKALAGCKAGDEKTAKVKFPKDYGAEAVAGEKATFEIKVHEVQALALPEIDDEFMAEFGIREGGIEAFRADVRKNMQRELNQRIREASKANVLDALHDAHQVELPRALVDQEAHSLQHAAMHQFGIEDHSKVPPVQSFRPMAEKRVRLSLLVQELIAKETIALDRARVDERIQELAAPYEMPDEAARLYRGNAELMAQIESAVLEDQVVDFLIEHGKTTHTKLDFDEFMKMQDAE